MAQVLNAFAGAGLIYRVYGDSIEAFIKALGTTRTGDNGLSHSPFLPPYPAPYFNGDPVGSLVVKIVGPAFFVMFVVATIDLRNLGVLANLGALMIGLAVTAIGMSVGTNAGYAINPARDLGPHRFAWVTGWGQTAMPSPIDGSLSWCFWVPTLGPLIGDVIRGPP